MTKEKKVVRNTDNEQAMPWGNETFVVGSVDEVNGHGAEEIAGLVPTRYELLVLVEHWYKKQLDDEWDYFESGQTGSTAIRVETFAWNRIHRVARLLGDDEVRRAIAEVKAEFSKEVDPDIWNIFLHGDEAQWRAIQEINIRMHELRLQTRSAEQGKKAGSMKV